MVLKKLPLSLTPLRNHACIFRQSLPNDIVYSMTAIECALCDPSNRFIVRTEQAAFPEEQELFVPELGRLLLVVIDHLKLMHDWRLPIERREEKGVVWYKDRQDEAIATAVML